MRISDWSSDVCSSDLVILFAEQPDILSHDLMELGPFEQVLAVIVIVDQLLETLNECQSIRDCGRCLDNIGERHVLKECGEFEQLLLRQFDDVLENCAQFSRVTFHCLSQKLKIKELGDRQVVR